MPVRTPRLAAPAGLLTLVPGACSTAAGPTTIESSPAEPSVAAAASAAQVYSYSFVLQGIAQVPLGDVITDCLGEPIEVHYNSRLRVMLTQRGSGERSLSSVYTNEMGSWAVGALTGTVYRVAGASLDKSTDGAGGYGNGASTWQTSSRRQLVGPGGTAFKVESTYGLTITPDGTPTAERLSATLTCR